MRHAVPPGAQEEAGAPPLGWRRRLLFTGAMLLLSLLLLVAGGEATVRLLVPAETFWPVSNIYRPAEAPGVLYTYRAGFEGTAFGVDLETNSLGFRGPEWPRQKTPGTLRIALVGDSHAFGFGVPYEDTVGEVLARLLEERLGRPAEVLNFGVNGFNSRQQRAVFDHYVLGYDPDLLLLLPANNDHDPPLRADADGWLHWDGVGENEKSRIVDKSIEKVEARTDGSWWKRRSRLVLYLNLMRQRLQFHEAAQTQRTAQHAPDARWMAPVVPGPISERLAEPVYTPLKAVVEEARARSLPVVLACFCSSPDYRRMLRRFAQEDGVPGIELLALFPEARSWEELTAQFGLGWDNHLNAVAHRRWATALADLIERRGLHRPAPAPGAPAPAATRP